MTTNMPFVFGPWSWLFETVGEIASIASLFQQSGEIGGSRSTFEERADVLRLERTLQRLDLGSDTAPQTVAANDDAGFSLKQAA